MRRPRSVCQDSNREEKWITLHGCSQEKPTSGWRKRKDDREGRSAFADPAREGNGMQAGVQRATRFEHSVNFTQCRRRVHVRARNLRSLYRWMRLLKEAVRREHRRKSRWDLDPSLQPKSTLHEKYRSRLIICRPRRPHTLWPCPGSTTQFKYLARRAHNHKKNLEAATCNVR